MKFARDEGFLTGKLPTEGWKRLEYAAPERKLLTRDQIDKICATAVQTKEDGSPRFRNGELFADYIRFMAACGARRDSALATRWSDVDFEMRQVHLRKTKYSKPDVFVDFNPTLENLLREMCQRRLPDSDYLFPATRGDASDGHVACLQNTLEEVRAVAGMPWFHFHLLRHYFISTCIMSGVDVLTVARWVAHEDGGVLIGKVYGHLSNEHAQRAAMKVDFGENPSTKSTTGATELDLSKISAADLLRLVQQLQPNTAAGAAKTNVE